jgi:hypothetical protein
VTHLANIAFRFVLVMGLVNLFADMTYEVSAANRVELAVPHRAMRTVPDAPDVYGSSRESGGMTRRNRFHRTRSKGAAPD